MKTLYHPDREAISLSNVLYALSDPIRLRVTRTLAACGDSSCGSLGLDVAKSNMSYHFRVLREAGIIRQRSEGTQRINCLRRDDLDARFPGLLDAILQADTTAPGRDVPDLVLSH
jgi:DNA-binding transcriptional ArsR family regulator